MLPLRVQFVKPYMDNGTVECYFKHLRLLCSVECVCVCRSCMHPSVLMTRWQVCRVHASLALVLGHVLNGAQQVGHVVCIKGISSHFKRWPGFSPPGTPVTHPLVHTPFKEPGAAAPLQTLSMASPCVYVPGKLCHTAKRSGVLSAC